MSAEKLTCPGCGAAYYAAEAACPACGQVNPQVAQRGRRARRLAGARAWLRRLVYLAVAAALAGLGWWAWQSQPLPAARALQRALQQRDAAAFVAACDVAAMAERLWRDDPELAKQIAGPLPAGAEQQELARCLQQAIGQRVAAGASLGGWAEADRLSIERVGQEFCVTAADDSAGEAMTLAHGRNWRVVGLPWRRLLQVGG